MPEKDEKKLVLLLLEGFGLSPAWRGNAVYSAHPENFYDIWNKNPHTIINCQSQKSESSYPNDSTFISRLFSGKNILSDHSFMNEQIQNQKYFFNETFTDVLDRAIRQNSALHLIGSLNGEYGKYSDIKHLKSLVRLAKSRRVYKIYIHLILDNSETSDPRKTMSLLDELNGAFREIGAGEIASLVGKKYLEDKNINPLNFIKAFRSVVMGRGTSALTAEQALAKFLKHNDTPHDYIPVNISFRGRAIGKINDFDCVVFYNFDNEPFTKFISSLVSNFPPYQGCYVPKFLDVVTMFSVAPQQDNIKVAFKRKFSEGMTEVLIDNDIDQLVISDSLRINEIQSCLISKTGPTSRTKAIISPVKLIASEYLDNYNETMNNMIRSFNESVSPKFIIMDIPSISVAARGGAIKDVIHQIKTVDAALPKLLSIAKEKKYDVLLASTHGLSANISHQNPSNQNLTPLVFVKHDSNAETTAYRGLSETLMYDILKRKEQLIDIAPTILEYFGVAKPSMMQGTSFLSHMIK